MMYSNYAINISMTIGSMIPSFTKTLQFIRDGSRAATTSKMERFVIIVNGWKRFTIITKRSILDVAAALDPRLIHLSNSFKNYF